MTLTTPIKDAGFAFKIYPKRLESLELITLEDLLYYIPFRYENYALISPINRLQPGEVVTVIGKVSQLQNAHTKQRFKTLQKATIIDATGSIDVVWFNQPYLTKMIHADDTIAIAGKVD